MPSSPCAARGAKPAAAPTPAAAAQARIARWRTRDRRSGSPDAVILSWAASDERILLTHDRDTMPNFVYVRVCAGEPMPGVFLVSNRMPKGQAVEELFWAVHCLPAEECKDQIKYFPL